MSCIVITGAGGLIGSACVEYFHDKYDRVIGIDNNSRAQFFGADGSVVQTIVRNSKFKNYIHYGESICSNFHMDKLFAQHGKSIAAVIHCAAQPSHDKAASIAQLDFQVNAVGTSNVLESTRRFAPEATFVFTSTNKVYGDAPNHLPLVELEKRFDYADARYENGIDESMSIDQCLHSLFGASKVAADILVQEYGRYFGMRTGVFRGGCLTGANHASVPLHGFLSYIVKAAKTGTKYTVHGYKAKQVRDQIHSFDVASAFEHFIANPRPGEVYNLGGEKSNAASILEIIDILSEKGLTLDWEYSDTNRIGDHICYYTDMAKFRQHFPKWEKKYALDMIIEEMLA